MKHLLLAVTDRAYGMERPADFCDLNGACGDRTVLLDEVDHSFTVVFNRRVASAVEATANNLVDLYVARQVVGAEEHVHMPLNRLRRRPLPLCHQAR